MPLCTNAETALRSVKSGHRVFIHGAAATPKKLVEGLVSRASEVSNVEIIHLHTEGAIEYAKSEYRDSFRVANLFLGSNVRRYFDFNRVDYLPCFLSEMGDLIRSGRRAIDVALIQVSPPDQHGFCTLGTSVDIAKAAVDVAPIVIAQINHRMPRVHGDGFIHMSHIRDWIEVDEPLPESTRAPLGEVEQRIGRLVAERIDSGSTLQIGIGSVPDAVLDALRSHKHLGIHSEMWSNGVLDLLKSGAVDNSRKCVHPGKTVSSFLMGTEELYDFIHDNPSVIQLEASYVNKAEVIARNPQVVAINSAVEVDLTGQICADSIGSKIISGVGGQMDFMRAAALSREGKPMIAMTSRTSRGESRIVPTLRLGAGVVTTRAHVHFVITEYGCVDLYGKTLSERARALISIAHPLDRENLEKRWHDITR